MIAQSYNTYLYGLYYFYMPNLFLEMEIWTEEEFRKGNMEGRRIL
jgi:hypothetical protein